MKKSIIYMTGGNEMAKALLLDSLVTTERVELVDPIMSQHDEDLKRELCAKNLSREEVKAIVFTENQRLGRNMQALRRVAKDIGAAFFSMEIEDLERFEAKQTF